MPPASNEVPVLMAGYARRTGLQPPIDHPQRYLWTDAFAVCNYLELFRQSGEDRYLECARRLVDQVHHTLGQHREDDLRTGWISGLDEPEGELHPTRGGLRIGKPLNERRPDESMDERLEWDRDGQYYHYLTKWMHALHQMSRVTGDPICLGWGLELARTAQAAFAYAPFPGARRRMYWKMSIDLSRPLVPSMGQHDPLDGFLTYVELQTARSAVSPTPDTDLSVEIGDIASICQGGRWVTDDPLGIGGLLFDAVRISELIITGSLDPSGLLEAVLEATLPGLDAFVRSGTLEYPAEQRLAFRELGLSIGLKGVIRIREALEEQPDLFRGERSTETLVETIRRYTPLAERIDRFWRDPNSHQAETWLGHRDINEVMLASSLLPKGFLVIRGR